MPSRRVTILLACTAASSLACGGPSSEGPGESSATSTTGATVEATDSTGSTGSTGSTDSTGTTETTSAGEPVCCGCLCLDPAWSCSIETCIFEDGTAEKLAPEAGFLAISPPAPAPQSRMWYAFRPADEDPEEKPLAVFFNGGPGASAAILFGINTNALTLDPDVAGEGGVVDNPSRWTRFANVLYIDPREAGFSYDVPRLDGEASESVPFAPEQDAAYFVRFVLQFLARHPQIQRNRVVLVGQSYGGHRAALMLNQLLFHDDLELDGRFREPDLHQEILDHYAVVFPDIPPEELRPEVVAGQFGHQVLIQPALTTIGGHGGTTPPPERPAKLGCIPDPDFRQCDELEGWPTPRIGAVLTGLLDPTTLSTALGLDATTIEWMYASARADAFPRGDKYDETPEESFSGTFGPLASAEYYYYPVFTRKLASPEYTFTNEYYGRVYLRVIPHVSTFITDAGKDLVIFAPNIPGAIASYTDTVSSAVHDVEPFADEPRPGRIFVTFAPRVVDGDPVRIVRFPYYASGGHTVSHKEGAAIAEDVQRWLDSERAGAGR